MNVQNVNKDYKIYDRPHDRLVEALLRRPKHKLFHVLEDITFDVGFGRSLGVIGDNGAGKSTLLKLLAGTVQPSSGTIEVHGRIAALLELGAGFHPEFSGRQNIYLNASLLGISQEEIKSKEYDIINFAELEEFIDRPVKTYSSGMYVRLAFSIATMVDPDILVIDEALAVGDIAFQRKCTDRMNRFREQGKTMIFCSHSMYHVQELCDRVIWIEKGRIIKSGRCDEVVGLYEDHCNRKKDAADPKRESYQAEPAPEKECRILSFELKTEDGMALETLSPTMPALLEMEVEILSDDKTPNFGFAVMTPDEEILAASLTNHEGMHCGPYASGQIVHVRYRMDFLPLRVGTFMLLGAVSDDTGLLWYDSKYLGPITIPGGKGMGRVSLKGEWKVNER